LLIVGVEGVNDCTLPACTTGAPLDDDPKFVVFPGLNAYDDGF
jgi:hypothetical protein